MTNPNNNDQTNTDNPYAKNDGDYPEEVRIQRERDRLAADSNAKAGSEVRDINVPKLAGSEELENIARKWLNEYRYSGAIVCREIPGALVREFLAWHNKSVAQSSAQAELRGRVDEVKRAIKWFEDESGYLFYLDDRLAQLRAQGGER